MLTIPQIDTMRHITRRPELEVPESSRHYTDELGARHGQVVVNPVKSGITTAMNPKPSLIFRSPQRSGTVEQWEQVTVVPHHGSGNSAGKLLRANFNRLIRLSPRDGTPRCRISGGLIVSTVK